MKKIMFFVMTVVALAFVSCSGVSTEKSGNDSIVSDSTDTVVVDSAALDSTVVVDSVAAVKK